MTTRILPGAFANQPKDEFAISPEVDNLVHTQIAALLMSSPSFNELPPENQQEMKQNLEKIAGYTAALIHDDWHQSQKLGQTPVVRKTKTVDYEASAADGPGKVTPSPNPMYNPALNTRSKPFDAGTSSRAEIVRTLEGEGPAPDEFAPRAASNVAQVTESTLNAIAFPTFVADLIKGTFNAIIDASIQQMEAFGELLSNVAKTVEDFMADNISDNASRDWIVGAFPRNYAIQEQGDGATLSHNEDLNEEEASRMRRTLNLPEDADLSDAEDVIVPAARRHIAQSRQQMLSSMVLMGINRIIVTRGRIRAQMGFRIDTKDYATASSAEKFDTKTEVTARYGWFLSPVKATAKTTVAYVSSNEKDSESEINVEANLTGEVDLQFKSDVFPLERFADAGVISSIQGNTANPAANQPITSMSS